MTLVMIDTKAGNFGSVDSALRRMGIEVKISNKPEDIEAAKALILPGVSAFEQGMNSLKKLNIVELIKKRALADKIPLLGICLGMQLLADNSTETSTGDAIEGLGLVKGVVRKLQAQKPEFTVPNMGWYDVYKTHNTPLFPETYSCESFYHVHSYHFIPANEQDIAANIDYGTQKVAVSLHRDNIFGAQFHPEKSQDAGLDFLQRFIKHI